MISPWYSPEELLVHKVTAAFYFLEVKTIYAAMECL